MAVVDVAHMGVGMGRLVVAVVVGMPERAIGHPIAEIFRTVGVIVVGIGVMRVMAVAMGMAQGFVVMPMAVLFAQQQGHTAGHQSRGQAEGGGELVSQHQQ